MSKDRLTKEEAFKLIPSVVDDEVDEATRSAFLAYIKEDSAMRNEFESMKRIKTLISTRCPSYNASQRLKTRVWKFLEQNKTNPQNNPGWYDHDSIIDIPSHIPSPASVENDKDVGKTGTNPASLKWLYAVAASFLIIAAFWVFEYSNRPAEITYQVEDYVYQHFQKNNGKLVTPNISTASLADAEVSLSGYFDTPIAVPPLENAEFKGVAYSEFVPGFEAPLLEYYLPKEDQYIYIFAFKVARLDQFGKLARDKEAIKKCIKPSDFHVENVKGKHVVSWRWNGIWYAAISNQRGRTLASLIKPLKYDTSSSK